MGRAARRLARIIAEVRRTEAPQVPVERLTQPLLAAFRAAAERGELRPAAASVARGWRLRRAALPVLAFGTVLVILAVVLIRPVGRGPDTALVAREPALESTAGLASLDGDALVAGAVLSAADRPLSVAHARRATWTLSPGSRARLLSAPEGVVHVELEHGVLSALVTPSLEPESFVVQARGTAVSVHGTRFEMALGELDRVTVRVTEGVVHVGAFGGNGATVLRAGMQADFVRGVRQAETPGTTSPAVAGVEAMAPGAPAPAGKVGGGPGRGSVPHDARLVPPRASRPAPPALVERALEQVSASIQACFRDHTAAAGEIRIEVSTRLVLSVQSDGRILTVALDPPLSPLVEQCVTDALDRVELGRTESGYRVERELHLLR